MILGNNQVTMVNQIKDACEENSPLFTDPTSICFGWEDLNTDVPSYNTFKGGLIHTYSSVFGGPNTDEYDNNPMSFYLYFLSLLMCLIMSIHMLNMLIAIMG